MSFLFKKTSSQSTADGSTSSTTTQPTSPAPSNTTPPTQSTPSEPLPWRQWFLDRLGWSENNPAQDAELSKGWQYTHECKGFTTCAGDEHAWCGMSLATALHACGLTYPEDCESADAWDGYGALLDWKTGGIPIGAVVVINHNAGGFHVSTANRDHKPGEQVYEALGGNQSDSINVTTFALSKNKIVWVGWPVESTNSTAPTPQPTPQNTQSLPWDIIPESRPWSNFLLSRVASGTLPDMPCPGVEDLVPAYADLTRDRRVTVWANLISIDCRYECSWDPKEYSVDVGIQGNRNTWSGGLMQLSVVDQESYTLPMGYSFDDLLDPIKNLTLGIAIMEKLIRKDQVFSAKKGGIWYGLGEYWSTLRTDSEEYAGIKQFMRSKTF